MSSVGRQSKQRAFGSVRIDFASRYAALRCQHHFNGCSWGDSTEPPVRASVETLPGTTVAKPGLSNCPLPPPAVEEMSMSLATNAGFIHELGSGTPGLQRRKFSAAPPVSDPSAARFSQSSTLSAAARTFRPAVSAAAASPGPIEQQASWLKLPTASDTSTDAGESSVLEDESRGGLGVFASAGSTLGPGSLLKGFLDADGTWLTHAWCVQPGWPADLSARAVRSQGLHAALGASPVAQHPHPRSYSQV